MSIKLPDSNSSLYRLKEFANVECIVTDLDGTFVQGQTVIGQFQRLQQKMGSLTFTIATGRTYVGAKPIVEQMGIRKGTPILLYNGAVVIAYQENKILHLRTIPCFVLNDLCKLIDMEHQYLLAYFVFAGQEDIIEMVYAFGEGQTSKDINGMNIRWRRLFDLRTCKDSLETTLLNVENEDEILNYISLFHHKFEPISILIDKRVIGDRVDRVEKYLEECPYVSYTSSGYGYLEINAQGVNKGIIFDYTKVQKGKKTVAIGDNDNDIQLLKKADIGVAVANSSLSAKQAAKYQCKGEGTTGVLELIQIIKEAKRYFRG